MRPSETVGEFSSSSEADADAAVAAAAEAAFAGWAALPMARRAAYLNAAAAVLEARTEQVARDMTTEMGKPLREARGEAGRAAQILRFAASEAFRSVGEHFEQAATGAQVSTRRQARRRRRADHAVELPDGDPDLEARAGARSTGTPSCSSSPTRRRAPACTSPRRSPRPSCRRACSTCSPAAARRSARRSSPIRACARSPSPAPSRPGTACATRRRRLGKRVQLELGGHNPLIVMADADLDRAVEAVVRRRVLVGGPEVHRDAADLRPGRGLRRVQGAAARAHRARQGRRPARSRRRGRPDRQRDAVRRDPRRDRARQGARAARCSPAASAPTTRAT